MLAPEGTGAPSVRRTGSTDLSFVRVGDVDGNGADDLVRFAANRFFVSWLGRSVWLLPPATHAARERSAARPGDDAASRNHAPAPAYGSWTAQFLPRTAHGRTCRSPASTSDRLMPEAVAGDFDGNGVDDLFRARNGEWRVSWGRGPGQPHQLQLVVLSAPASSLRVGEFDGDGADEVFYANGSSWRVSSAPQPGVVEPLGHGRVVAVHEPRGRRLRRERERRRLPLDRL